MAAGKKNKNMLVRHNTIRLFDEHLAERILYVCAPAGYGKTVAVTQWLEKDKRSKAFLAIDEHDNNASFFCERFCAALRTCQPRNKTLEEVASNPAFGSAPGEFALRAVSALGSRKQAVLVLDDLHLLRDEKALRMLLTALKRLPPNFQTVLLSRSELPPGFSEFWIAGQAVRIGADELRFHEADIMRLCKQRGRPVNRAKAEKIARLTQGWAIAVNAYFLAGGKLTGEITEHLDAYIASNLWEQWGERIRTFLLGTAFLRELNPPLCATVTGMEDSEELLAGLAREGAFIRKTGDGVYQYHHLFQDFLRRMVEERGEGERAALLSAEGNWYLERKDFFGAIDCFLAAENPDGIAAAFVMRSGDSRGERSFMRMLQIVGHPAYEAAAKKHPNLYGMLSWRDFYEGRAEAMAQNADLYYRWCAENMQLVIQRGGVHRLMMMRILDYRVSLSEMLAGVAALPEKPKQTTGTASTLTMNMPLIHRSISDFSELAAGDAETNVGHARSQLHWLFGEETDLLAESMAACLLYEKGLLEKAHNHALAANALIHNHTTPEFKFHSMSVLTYVLDTLGERKAAGVIMRRIEKMIEADGAYYLSRNYSAMAARFGFEGGDVSAATGWLETRPPAIGESLTLYGLYETFTACRAYIATGDYSSGVILLQKTLALAMAYHRPLDSIEAQILLAIAYRKKKRGFQADALLHLEAALALAYPYGYTQMFIKEGAELEGLLQKLLRRASQKKSESKVPADFIKMICMKSRESVGAGLAVPARAEAVKFTEKQITVMRLLRDGKNYREIAELMNIKPTTLRSHIKLIYTKLDVTNVQDAVERIRVNRILEQ